MQHRLLLLSVLFPLLLAPMLSVSQADVNESLETAFLYVDAIHGSDSNPGTKLLPLQTISAAAALATTNNYNNIGTRVTINPGTYRESVMMTASLRNTSMPITFEAAINGTAVISGAVVYSGWTKDATNPNLYTNAWNNTWGVCAQYTACPYQQEIVMRQEMLIINGVPMTQVLAMSQMRQGTFLVDTTNAIVYVWPPAGTNMSTATVEVATLPQLFTLENMSNIVLRGLTFQYANSCHFTPAVKISNPNNVLLDSDTFQWNNARGLSFADGSYFTVQNSLASHNGDNGFHEVQTLYGLWQSDTTSYNNWRGAQGAYYACGAGGVYFYEAHNDNINGFTTAFNQSWGIHWDTDNENITTTGILASGNLLAGLFVEKDEGPVTFSQAYVCNQTLTTSPGGLALRNSEQVSLTNSVVLNNANSQVAITGTEGGIEVTNWQTGQQYNLITQNFTNTGNTIEATTSSQQVFADAALNGSDWTSFQTTLVSNNNTWWNADSTTPFTVPIPHTKTSVNFSGWQSDTLQDSSSIFAAPSGNPGQACTLTPEPADFWLTADSTSVSTNSSGNAPAVDFTITPLNLTGTVELSLDGISEVPGLTATLSPNSIITPGTTALSIKAAANTAPGTYPITVIATHGSKTRTATISLVVP